MLEQELLLDVDLVEFDEDDKLDDLELQLGLWLEELELWLLLLLLPELDEQLLLIMDEDSELHDELSDVSLEEVNELEEHEQNSTNDGLLQEELHELELLVELQLEEQQVKLHTEWQLEEQLDE